MAEKQSVHEWALEQYRHLVQTKYPTRLKTWPILSGYNVKIANLPGNGIALIFDHTGNPVMVSSSGIGDFDQHIIGQPAVTAQNADVVRDRLEEQLGLGAKDGVLVVVKTAEGYVIPPSQLSALLTKHEMLAGLTPMKIFLSHKGVDKEMVRRFERILTLLGFIVWLDEDAMPAGQQPDRAIDQGFRDSCAAIFFVTPDFKDENWLASEIEYARREKREKGDLFAIITLCMSKKGKSGLVPSLLKNYIYKTPLHELEALSEIIRALPVSVGAVRFR